MTTMTFLSLDDAANATHGVRFRALGYTERLHAMDLVQTAHGRQYLNTLLWLYQQANPDDDRAAALPARQNSGDVPLGHIKVGTVVRLSVRREASAGHDDWARVDFVLTKVERRMPSDTHLCSASYEAVPAPWEQDLPEWVPAVAAGKAVEVAGQWHFDLVCVR